LFATKTGYHDLDQRITTPTLRCGCRAGETRVKKASLLLVLQHPELHLHNNASELAVRQRDASFGPRTQLGLQA